jgi:hypothetical protein
MRYLKTFETAEAEGILSASEILTKTYEEPLGVQGKWKIIFGDLTPDFTAMVSGQAGSGKTSMLLELSYYLAKNHGSVLYISSEEYDSLTLVDKLKDVLRNRIFKSSEVKAEDIPSNLYFAKDLRDLKPYDFIIIDSVNEMDLDIRDYREIRDIYPDKAFIMVFQVTKAGEFRGENQFRHETGFYAEIDNGVIDVKKNRYGKKVMYDYFNSKILKVEDKDR